MKSLATLVNQPQEPTLSQVASLRVGDRIWFAEEKLAYTIQARSRRFFVCNKPFNLRKTVLYCIVDFKEMVRGPENLVFGMGAETREQCERMLARLEDTESGSEVSHRRAVPLRVRRISRSESPRA